MQGRRLATLDEAEVSARARHHARMIASARLTRRFRLPRPRYAHAMTERSLELGPRDADFGEPRAVDDVSLFVSPGEVVGLLGPNGAGRPPPARAPGLLTRLGRGAASGGRRAPAALEARQKLGFLTASTASPSGSPGARCHHLRRAAGPRGDRLAARLAAVSKELELDAFLDTRCGVMSSGQKAARLARPRGWCTTQGHRARRATAMLDPVARRTSSLVGRSQEAGRAPCLFSTHRMEEADTSAPGWSSSGRARWWPRTTGELLEQAHERSLTAAFLTLAGRPE